MPVARVPADLRDRTDLTLADIERIAALRKARTKLAAKADTLEAEAKATREAVAANVAEEAALLAAD